MNSSIYIIFLLSCIFLSGKEIQKKRSNQWWTTVIAAVMVWMVLLSNHKGDNLQYARTYELASQYQYKDGGYGILCIIGDYLRLDFFLFKKILISIALYIWLKAQKKYVKNMTYVFALYLASFVFMDSQVMRNFLAMCILMRAVEFLTDISNKKNIVLFVICVLIAASIHKAFIFYLIFLTVLCKERTQFAKVLFSIGIAITVITIINNNHVPFLNILLAMFSSDDRSEWLKTTTRLGAVPVLVLYIYMLLIIWNFAAKQSFPIVSKKINYVQLVFLLDICMAPILPLVITNLNFYRLIKNIVVMNYGVLSIAYQNNKKVKRRAKIIVSSAALAVGWFLYETQVFATYESVVVPVFEGYMFFE